MKLQLDKSTTSVILTVFVMDDTASDGSGLGSLDQTSSITGGYVRMGATGVALTCDENVTTEGTYEAPSAAGKVRIGTPANMETGIYELHFHNDLFATGAEAVTISLSGAADMAPLIIEVQLVTPAATRDAAIADAVWDEILTGGTHNIATSAGRRLRALEGGGAYEHGCIWIDTVNGVAGTADFENGTASNPVDTLADAVTIAASLGMNRFFVIGGSSIQLVSSHADATFLGDSTWDLDLNGQTVNGIHVQGAHISGVMAGTGDHQEFVNCHMGATSVIKGTHYSGCGIEGTQTMVEAGDIFFDQCFSGIAGTSTWVFDFGAVGTSNLNMRNYSGGVQLENMGDSGTDTASIEGQGQILEGTCTGGTVAVRGCFTVSGIQNITLYEDARIAADQIATAAGALLRGTSTGSSTTLKVFVQAGDPPSAASDDDYNDLVLVVWSTADKSGAVNVRNIDDYDDGDPSFTVSPALSFTPDSGDLVEVWRTGTCSASPNVNVVKIAGLTPPADRLALSFPTAGGGIILDQSQAADDSTPSSTGDAFKTIIDTLPTGSEAAGASGGLPLLDANLLTNADMIRISGGATEADRLEAALTAGAGIDINMAQTNPGSPTADTVGDAMANAAQSLPNQLAPGTLNGLARLSDIDAISDASLRLVATTMQAGSTTTDLIADAPDLPTTTDDIYNDVLLIAYDNSAGGKPNIRTVDNYVAASRTFTLDAALDFTPETGVDPFEVWSVPMTIESSVSLPELTTGFSAANPDNLNSYLKAAMQAAASVPAGLGTYTPATDALEAARDRLNLMAGAGFETSTDSLEAIRNAIDDLIAPAIISTSGTLSGVGFLSECVSLIRKATDEPDTGPKYPDTDLIEYIHSAFDQVLASINVETDHPILVRYEVSVVQGTMEYLLPCNVAEIWRIAKIDSTTGVPLHEVWPTNQYTFRGDGFTVEGNILRFQHLNRTAETLEVLYIASGDVSIHTATASAGTDSTITFPASPTDGSLDIRPHAYAGYTVRLLDATGEGQERIVSAYDAATRVATVRPDWATAPDDTTVYEVLPQYSRLIKHVVANYATLDVLSNEAKSTRRAEIERQLQRKMSALKMMLAKKVRRFGGQGPGVDTYDNTDLWPMLP